MYGLGVRLSGLECWALQGSGRLRLVCGETSKTVPTTSRGPRFSFAASILASQAKYLTNME